MTALARLNGMDSRAWSTATWSAVLLTQLVLALIITISWLLGKQFPGTPGFGLFLVSAAALLPLCVVSSGLLIRSASSRAHGLAVSIVGSYAVVLVGGTAYGVWISGW